ncbi:hypothetical protein K505DRAFT_375142 [Melanomma pulvis-pyrius CBS 109.77]|uniref:Uncharacterized protein n=1 Tax=Melanomma pulvis-pyrius CBS 109.77 TaxID=1314802 RepID=A0A6A6XDG7_9PLEO|nr:hypothetical protein K505DRAFT_375142 [Melanomma pulvis-pyrius CBS 109.77]
MDTYNQNICAPASLPPFLALPREVRDLIYDYLLVHDKVSVKNVVIDPPPWVPEKLLHVFQTGLKQPVVRRQTWRLPADHVLDPTYVEEGELFESVEPGKELQMSFKIAPIRDKSSGIEIEPCLNIHLMLVCRQLYSEAREVFYSKNTFQFTGDFRIPTALAFLLDRTLESLSYIRSLELALTETCWSHPDQFDQYTSPGSSPQPGLVLRYAYDYFRQLCSLIASSSMSLQSLRLNIDTFDGNFYRGGVDSITVNGLLLHEEQNPGNFPLWLDPLLSIRDLDNITLWWDSTTPMMRRIANVASLMQERMLKPDIISYKKKPHIIDFKLCIGFNTLSSPPPPDGTDFLLHYNIDRRDMEWERCNLRIVDLNMIEAERESCDKTTDEREFVLQERGSVFMYFSEMKCT